MALNIAIKTLVYYNLRVIKNAMQISIKNKFEATPRNFKKP